MDSPVGDDLGLGIRLPDIGRVNARGHRAVHPITPVIHGLSVIPLAILLMIGVTGSLLDSLGFAALAAGVGGAVVAGVIATGYQYLAWRALEFWFDEDGDLRVDSGVITRAQRRLQLSRLQSIDVSQPFIARLFSMAAVTVEVAGSGDSRVELRYLSLADARALRSQVLAGAAGLRHDTAEAPEQPVMKVAPRDLALSLLLRTNTVTLLGATVLILALSWRSEGPAGIGLAMLTGGLPIAIVIAEFIRYFDFTVAESPDGLRLRFGMTRTQTRTVPPGRIQAIEIVEPLLWRRMGWVRLRVNIAGVADDPKEEALLAPVASLAAAEALIARVLPGVDVVGKRPWITAPPRARWRSPVQWRSLAISSDDYVVETRCGRITKRRAFVPHPRTQSIRLTQGPWERVLRLATMHVDSTPGPVKVAALHIDAQAARALAEAQARLAGRARTIDTTIHWALPEDQRPAGT
jgi:putative membrane protein